MKGLTEIVRDGEIYAIVLRKEYDKPGPSFFTPGEFSQQLGMLVHPKGKEVKRHRHKLVKREIFRTQEVLLLLEGRVRVDICTDEGEKIKTFILRPGDGANLTYLNGALVSEPRPIKNGDQIEIGELQEFDRLHQPAHQDHRR